jgi:hypothetical protein
MDLTGHDREIDAVVGDDRRETLGDAGKLQVAPAPRPLRQRRRNPS